jgi:hypothetical protein
MLVTDEASDNNLKSHVQQRPPGVIFRLEVLGLLLAS